MNCLPEPVVKGEENVSGTETNKSINSRTNESAKVTLTAEVSNSQMSSKSKQFVNENANTIAKYVQNNDMEGLNNFLKGDRFVPESVRSELLEFFKPNMQKMNKTYETQQNLSDAIAHGNTSQIEEYRKQLRLLTGNDRLAEQLEKLAFEQSVLTVKKEKNCSTEEAFEIASKNALIGGISLNIIYAAGRDLGFARDTVSEILKDVMRDAAMNLVQELNAQMRETGKTAKVEDDKKFKELEEKLEELVGKDGANDIVKAIKDGKNEDEMKKLVEDIIEKHIEMIEAVVEETKKINKNAAEVK